MATGFSLRLDKVALSSSDFDDAACKDWIAGKERLWEEHGCGPGRLSLTANSRAGAACNPRRAMPTWDWYCTQISGVMGRSSTKRSSAAPSGKWGLNRSRSYSRPRGRASKGFCVSGSSPMEKWRSEGKDLFVTDCMHRKGASECSSYPPPGNPPSQARTRVRECNLTSPRPIS